MMNFFCLSYPFLGTKTKQMLKIIIQESAPEKTKRPEVILKERTPHLSPLAPNNHLRTQSSKTPKLYRENPLTISEKRAHSTHTWERKLDYH